MSDPDKQRSLRRSVALSLAGATMLVPAYLTPVLSTHLSGTRRTDTIFSGVVGLCQDGMWGIGAIVFTASILVPMLKLVGLGWLQFEAWRGTGRHAREMTRCYAVLEMIGRWSMLDVFLVAFLTGAVEFGNIGTIEPRPGIIAFACVVILTLLATQAYNPRLLLWNDANPIQA